MRPLLFVIPGVHVPVFSYGLMLVLSLAVAWYLIPWLCAREGLARAHVENIFYVTTVGALLGAKLLFVASNFTALRDDLRGVLLSSGGLVAYGGLVLGSLSAAGYCLWRRLPLGVWVDNAVPALCIAFGLMRVGCYLAGCDFGTLAPEGAWYAVRFPAGSPAFLEHAARWPERMNGASASLPVHATQIYESLLGFALLPLMLLVRRWRRTPGEVFLAFLIGYGLGRLALESLRGDSDRGAIGPLSTSSFIALLSALGAAALWARLRLPPGRLAG